jgi:ferredoxin
VKIKLDRTKCDGFGICAVYAPDIFTLDEWGYASTEFQGVEIPADREADVRRALLDCPVHAILELREKAAADRPAG